jgi:hypothetical protein
VFLPAMYSIWFKIRPERAAPPLTDTAPARGALPASRPS